MDFKKISDERLEKIMSKIIWKEIKKKQWENQEKKRKYDFYITQQKSNRFILDIFDSKIKDNDDAYIESKVYTSLQLAKKEAQKWT